MPGPVGGCCRIRKNLCRPRAAGRRIGSCFARAHADRAGNEHGKVRALSRVLQANEPDQLRALFRSGCGCLQGPRQLV